MSRVVPILLLALAAPSRAAAPPARQPPEGLKMFLAIVSGKPPGPPGGWFGPAKSAYGWDWLAERYDADRDGAITPKEFRGSKAFFQRLDRDGDGKLTRADFDARPRASSDPRERMLDMVLGRADRDRDGRISAEEWQALFEQAAGEKGEMTREDLRRLLLPGAQKAKGPPSKGGGMPSQLTLLRGLFSGEIGSLHEGPSVGDAAPGFTLRTQDGKRAVSLSEYKGKRPVVLIFGSFT
ncbi:MAG: EF-hand domain-containing protein [Gemmataceae bacterium]